MLRTPSRVEHFVLRFRRLLSVVVQLLLVVAANRVAFWLRFDGALPPWALSAFWQALPWLVVIRGLTFVPFQLYEGLWRYTSIWDLRDLLAAVAGSSVLAYVLFHGILGLIIYPRAVFVIDAILLTMMLGGIRLTAAWSPSSACRARASASSSSAPATPAS
jgi:FlaA1/EpsC-like NDP-sugar epimerase